MSDTAEKLSTQVPPEEAARRIAEMRQAFWEHRVPADVVYHPPHHPCPWPGCPLQIAGIRFELDKLGQPDRLDDWFYAWWQGSGLIARCPGCTQYVLFGIFEKQAVADPALLGAQVLPEDWSQKSYLITRPAKV